MQEHVTEHDWGVSIRHMCNYAHAHGGIIGIPPQWRGPNIVKTMLHYNKQGFGYETITDGNWTTLPFPVS